MYHRCGLKVTRMPWVDIPTSAFSPLYAGSTNESLKPFSQVSLAQRMCTGAERGSANQLSLYTSPSLPNITLGLPATATATAASNVKTSAALHPRFRTVPLTAFPLSSRWPQRRRMVACSRRSPSARRFSPAAIWLPTWPRQGQEQAGTPHTARCFNTWCSWSKAQHRAPWWQVGVSATCKMILQLVAAALAQLMRSNAENVRPTKCIVKNSLTMCVFGTPRLPSHSKTSIHLSKLTSSFQMFV